MWVGCLEVHTHVAVVALTGPCLNGHQRLRDMGWFLGRRKHLSMKGKFLT